MSDRPKRRARVAGLGNLSWAGLLLLAGELLWQDLSGRAPTDVERGVVRVLGVRHLGQGLAQVVAPEASPQLWRLVDLAHVASLLPVVALDARRRRPAALSAAVSLVGALVSAPAAREAARRSATRRAQRRPVLAPRRARR